MFHPQAPRRTFSFSLHFLHPHIDGLHRRMVVDSKFAPGQRPSRMSPVMTSGMEMESHLNPPKVSTSVILRVKYYSVLLSNTQRCATRNHWTWAPGQAPGQIDDAVAHCSVAFIGRAHGAPLKCRQSRNGGPWKPRQERASCWWMAMDWSERGIPYLTGDRDLKPTS